MGSAEHATRTKPARGNSFSAPASGKGIATLVEEWVERGPEACAVREPLTGRSMNYRELWLQAGRLAEVLAAEEVRPGDLVAVDLPRSLDLVVAFLGVVRARAAYLPLDVHAPAERIAGIVEESGSRVLICAPSAEAGRRARLPSGVRVLSVPQERGEPDSPSAPAEAAAGEDPIYVTYTSGSTGRPKGVVIPHRAVNRLVVEPNYCTIEPGDRVANTCNPAFDVTTCEIWSTLTSGGTVVPFPLLTDVTMNAWADLVRTEEITTMFLTTSLFHTVAWERPDAFGSMKNLVVGGEQLDLAAVRRVLAARPPTRLVNGYGPTEATAFATFFECTVESLAGVERIPIGHALQKTTVHVLDEDLNPVPAGETGELCLGGPGVATGYLNRPELTAERFVIEPSTGERVYRTGDLVREVAGGALEMLGRKDRQIKLRGFRIELEEIERVAVSTGLVDAAFVEKVGAGASAELVAFLLPAKGTGEDVAGALAAGLAGKLPGYMIPAHWHVLSELPVGATGKADRARMLALFAEAGREDPAETGSFDDPVLAQVKGILRDVLGRSNFSAADNFLDIGGNSVLAVQVASRIQQRYAVPLEPADVLLAESFDALAVHVRSAVS
ncbi:amino acid adenylation protein [Amycolatopsis sp. WAC 01376]|nr:amino acid adenylation protein [Amycolatopsis sp. WAC 01376]